MCLDKTKHAGKNRVIYYAQANLEYQTKINTTYYDRNIPLKTGLKIPTAYWIFSAFFLLI